MRLLDLIRSLTLAERDSLANTERRLRDGRDTRSAAEEEYKRVTTEISRLHTAEREARRTLGGVESKIGDVREELEELERRRTALHERLLEYQTEQQTVENLVGETRGAAQLAEDKLADSRERITRLDHELKDLEQERQAVSRRCGDAYRRGIRQFLAESAARIDQRLATETDFARRQRMVESLKAARHSDPAVGDLCDQRDQYRELLTKATVPGVKSTVETALKAVEAELERRFPGALTVPQGDAESGSVEELYYFRGVSNLVTVLLPIEEATWTSIGAGVVSPRTRNSARVIWSFVRRGGLTARDGQFSLRDGFCVFETNLDEDALAVLGTTSLSLEGASSLHLTVIPLPTEAKEALLDEDSTS